MFKIHNISSNNFKNEKTKLCLFFIEKDITKSFLFEKVPILMHLKNNKYLEVYKAVIKNWYFPNFGVFVGVFNF